MRFAARILGWTLAAAGLPVVIDGVAGPLAGALAAAATVLATLWLWLWLPRSAHAAFDAGHPARAARRYRVLGALAATARRERAALVSRAACSILANDAAAAEPLLAALDPAQLSPGERAVWLNNRACARLVTARDPAAALALADEATALRPDVPALQHTRAMALLAVGRTDDAIAVLDGMRAAGELSPRLEAERCRELSRAWAAKGEHAYAEDYRLRARGFG